MKLLCITDKQSSGVHFYSNLDNVKTTPAISYSVTQNHDDFIKQSIEWQQSPQGHCTVTPVNVHIETP